MKIRFIHLQVSQNKNTSLIKKIKTNVFIKIPKLKRKTHSC